MGKKKGKGKPSSAAKKKKTQSSKSSSVTAPSSSDDVGKGPNAAVADRVDDAPSTEELATTDDARAGIGETNGNGVSIENDETSADKETPSEDIRKRAVAANNHVDANSYMKEDLTENKPSAQNTNGNESPARNGQNGKAKNIPLEDTEKEDMVQDTDHIDSAPSTNDISTTDDNTSTQNEEEKDEGLSIENDTTISQKISSTSNEEANTNLTDEFPILSKEPLVSIDQNKSSENTEKEISNTDALDQTTNNGGNKVANNNDDIGNNKLGNYVKTSEETFEQDNEQPFAERDVRKNTEVTSDATKNEITSGNDLNLDESSAIYDDEKTEGGHDHNENDDSFNGIASNCNSDDETETTYVDDIPLFHYSRIASAGLPRGIANPSVKDTDLMKSTCSELAEIRIDPEDLVVSSNNTISGASTSGDSGRAASGNNDDNNSVTTAASASSAAAVARNRRKEQMLLLSSDLWRQPHLILATGYDDSSQTSEGKITFTRVQRSSTKTSSPASSVVFATVSTDIGVGGRATTPSVSSSGNKYSNVSTELYVRERDSGAYRAAHGTSIVDVSFDSSGSVVGAIDKGGHCAIWEFKYTTSLQYSSLVFGDSSGSSQGGSDSNTPTTTPTSTRPPVSTVAAAPSMFSNFMSVITGIPPPDESFVGGSTHGFNSSSHGSTTASPRRGPNTSNNTQSNTLVPTLTAEIQYQSRVNYPHKWGPPTCMVIDPAYKQKREKSMVVGFANGELYLTKRGNFFQRRNDTVLYQAPHAADRGSKNSSDSYRGIETIVWRGPLVAWADASGIKLMDMDHLTRIAHIDRPAGASPFLYPMIRDVEPSLLFETAQHLLVGWGDCLMQIYIEEHDDETSAISASTVGSDGASGTSKVKKRRSVACTMAWELDCVACDVVPLDKDNVAVLGLVSLTNDVDVSHFSHDLEMQILSRKDGTIAHSDSLPLIKGSVHQNSSNKIDPAISVRNFRLMSSFALPRMDDDEETKVLRALGGTNDMGYTGIDVSFDMNQPLFALSNPSSNTSIEFHDPHMQWNTKSITFDGDDDIETAHKVSSDDSSIDSDDYECILRPIETIQPLPPQFTMNTAKAGPPPIMVVCTDSDAVLSLTSTIDDAVGNSLDKYKCAEALSRGLSHKRQLRRYDLDELINYYLRALLRISAADDVEGDTKDKPAPERRLLPSSSLSLRRMQLAVKAMPVLLGDRTELWTNWTKELENIPGALFFLRNYLPVRDPILPSEIYLRILERMIVEVEHLSQVSKEEIPTSIDLYMEASRHFLESLLAWGPTKVLKDFISFYKYNRGKRQGIMVDKDIRVTEISLQRRYLQTAASYLIFPVRDVEEELEVSAPKYEVHNVDTEDSLFDVSMAVAFISPRVPLVALPGDLIEKGLNEVPTVYASSRNNHTCLEAMARLRMMQGEYDQALKCFLAIGACHAKDSLESFENTAIRIVNSTDVIYEIPPSSIGNRSYDFVMNLIETHVLNQFLFEKNFLLSTDSKLFMPMFALIRLVGLRRVGTFLMEHYVAADFTYDTTLKELNNSDYSDEPLEQPTRVLRLGSLPIDKVAEQLENSPAILLWYLHLVFTRRPDFYVNFPTNSLPSKSITDLHRKHFQLYVDFAGETRDSSKVLSGIESYKVESKTTPLLTFLKVALPLGGILPVDARRVLEVERSKETLNKSGDNDNAQETSSPVFALELAYIIEMYSEQTETEALGILNLYLKGAKSLPLSVSYAQRQKQFSSKLWDRLISHCLEKTSSGALFGELLEAAALFGADLARLVERIPPGMVVEGLRPRLVAAVADYRMKLEIYEAALSTGSEEEVVLMREIGHRARRGVRYNLEKNQKSFAELIQEKIQNDEEVSGEAGRVKNNSDEPTDAVQKISRPKLRRDHKRLVFSLPRR